MPLYDLSHLVLSTTLRSEEYQNKDTDAHQKDYRASVGLKVAFGRYQIQTEAAGLQIPYS